jgi:DNA-binding ferritin-like protein
MNKGIPSGKTSLSSSKTDLDRSSDQMLSQLLTLNEEMIVQLRVERMESAGTADFLAGMIRQHEKAAASLRAQLISLNADDGTITLPLSFEEPIGG